jgi:hypothetical protein
VKAEAVTGKNEPTTFKEFTNGSDEARRVGDG